MFKPFVILDSTPLALLVQRKRSAEATPCTAWYERGRQAGVRFFVPEIIVYELRRELLRLGKAASLIALDQLIAAEPGRLLVLNTAALALAAELWARVRRQGRPTAGPDALDVDVILAAQVLTAGWDVQHDTVTATSNAKHVGLFVPAAEWRMI